MSGQRREIEMLTYLNRGGFGSVYRARWTRGAQSELAVKVMNHGLGSSPSMEALLMKEAELLQRLRHRAIVRCFGLVQVEGRDALVMEYLPGVDLSLIARSGPLPVDVALRITAEMAGALNAAWERRLPDGRRLRVIHRDIKPANVRVSPSGRVTVLDFGIARSALGESLERSGTCAYMAPERLGKREEGHASDVYSLGATLFELLVGNPLGMTSSLLPMHCELVAEADARMQSAKIPDEVRLLVLRMLSFHPGLRPTAARVRRAALALAPGRGCLRAWAATTFGKLQALPAWSPTPLPSLDLVTAIGWGDETMASAQAA